MKLYSLTAAEHDPADVPAWFNMSEKEFFPFVDKYGQFKFREWPGKARFDGDLKAAAEKERKELAGNPGPVNRDRFGGWTAGGKREATGHFRTEKSAANGGSWIPTETCSGRTAWWGDALVRHNAARRQKILL